MADVEELVDEAVEDESVEDESVEDESVDGDASGDEGREESKGGIKRAEKRSGGVGSDGGDGGAGETSGARGGRVHRLSHRPNTQVVRELEGSDEDEGEIEPGVEVKEAKGGGAGGDESGEAGGGGGRGRRPSGFFDSPHKNSDRDRDRDRGSNSDPHDVEATGDRGGGEGVEREGGGSRGVEGTVLGGAAGGVIVGGNARDDLPPSEPTYDREFSDRGMEIIDGPLEGHSYESTGESAIQRFSDSASFNSDHRI